MNRVCMAMVCGVAFFALAEDAFAQRRRGGRGSSLPEQYCWMSNYQKAKTIAKKSDEPMMVVFRCVP